MDNVSSEKPNLPIPSQESKIRAELYELDERVARGEISIKDAKLENERLVALLAQQVRLGTTKNQKGKKYIGPAQLGKLAFLLILLTVLYFFVFHRTELNEYKFYATESHPNLDFEFYDLSEDWSEIDLKEKFNSVSLKCSDDRSLGDMGDRSCYVDIQRHNNIPAMLAVFFFKNGKLNAATLHIPRWAHKKMRDELTRRHGSSTIKTTPDHSLMDKWTLNDRSALLYNTEPSSIIGWSAVFWMSHRATEKKHHFGFNR